MATIGYLAGTNSLFLTKISLAGFSTLPLGNGFDGHGKYVAHLSPQDDVCLVVAYLHKLLPTPDTQLQPSDFLFACRTNNIPVLVVAPTEEYGKATELLGSAAELVTLVDRDELYDKALKIAQGACCDS